jgi:hypothetical protein
LRPVRLVVGELTALVSLSEGASVSDRLPEPDPDEARVPGFPVPCRT